MISVVGGDPRDPGAMALLRQSHAILVRLYPSEANHHLSTDGLCSPDITFLTANRGESPIGVGALADRGTYGEVKSVFVSPDARNAGAGAAILDVIETEARARSLSCLRLETGAGLDPAIRLYRRAGFSVRGPFGGYRDDPLSIFMEKSLVDGRSPIKGNADQCYVDT